MENSLSNNANIALVYAKTALWEIMMPEGEITLSPSIEALLGYKPDHFKNYKDILDLIHPEQKEQTSSRCEGLFTGKNDQYECEFRLKHKNGSYIWFKSIGGILGESEGKTYYGGTISDISKKKQKENEFQLIAENTSDGIMIYEEGKIIYVSPAYKNLLGYNDDEERGRTEEEIMELIHPEDREKVNRTIYGAINAKEELVKYQFRAKRRDGKYIWREDHARFIYDDEGNYKRAYVVCHDVTDRKEMEDEVKSLSDLKSLLVEIASEFINLPLDDINVVIKKTLTKIAGFFGADRVYIFNLNAETGICSNTYEWCGKDIEPQIDELQNIPLAEDWIKKFQNADYVIIPDIKELPHGPARKVLEPQGILSLLAVPMMNKNDCIGFVGFDYVRDYHICSEKEIDLLKVLSELLVNLMNKKKDQIEILLAKEKVEESERTSCTLINESPIGIIHFEPDGKILAINKSLLKIVGSPSLEDSMKITLIESENVKITGFIDDVKQCIEKRTIISNKTPFRSQWGQEAILKYYLAPVITSNIVTSIIANIEDITDYEMAKKEMILAKEKAEESNRLKRAFLQNLSHEVRTPLNGIMGFSEIVIDDDIDTETKIECKNLLKASSERLMSLIDNVITLSRLETEQFEAVFEHFQIRELFKDIDSFFRKIANAKGLDLAINHYCNCKIYSDRTAMYGIITSFVENAIKFTNEGKVEIGCKDYNNNELCLYVKDTGIGIRSEDISKIFEKFVQLDDSYTREREGSGIGLSIADGLAKHIGARIEVISEPNIGSTFLLYIPYNDTEKHETQRIENTTKSIDTGSINALVAEDDESNYVYIKMMLNRFGIKHIRVSNGKEAVERIKESPEINLVLLDIKMPVMDGFEAFNKIKKIRPDIYIIAQTAFANSENIEKIKRFGFDGFVTKPIKKEKIIELINLMNA
jgi:PAS domain S-box-containing protein